MGQPKTQPIRLNLELTAAVNARLERLVVDTEAASRAEVIRRALAVYESLVDARRAGKELILRSPDGTEQIVLLIAS
jgi:Arc/MetJ-type ribon-helix-helix transcriptional regulator